MLHLLWDCIKIPAQYFVEGFFMGLGGVVAGHFFVLNMDDIKLFLGFELDKWRLTRIEADLLKNKYEPKYKVTINEYNDKQLCNVIIGKKYKHANYR